MDRPLHCSSFCALYTFAMAADVINGFRCKKLWFPCKFFSLNATSLTLLAVAMKLPVDLTTHFHANHDKFAMFSSLVFMSTAMGNFAPSIGSMEDREILSNVTALAILVITIIANVCIQLFELSSTLCSSRRLSLETIFICIVMLLLLVNIVSSAITVPITKKFLQTKYKEMQKIIMNGNEEQEQNTRERFRVDKQRDALKKHMVMAETSSPQFVMARSVICATSGALCLLALFTLILAILQLLINTNLKSMYNSPYGWSTILIGVIQSIGVAVGTISPTMRWFFVVGIKWSHIRSFTKAFKIETYWIQRLVDWREFSTPSQTRHRTCSKHLHNAKGLLLNFCIGVQIWNVLVSKIVVLISALLLSPFLFLYTCIKKLKIDRLHGVSSPEVELSPYVLLVEGEKELPKGTLDNIIHQADRLIQAGEKQQLRNLIGLLEKSGNLSGIREFDSYQVPSLHIQEPPNCWSLPIVTLASIALAIPGIANNKTKQFMSSVSEGISLAKLIEDTLDTNGELANIRNAAAVSWIGVVYYRRWQEIALHESSGKLSKEILQEFSDKAERTVVQFKGEVKDILTQNNHLNWPAKVIAANSMYRISRTVLLAFEGYDHPTDEGLFERLNVMISDILTACLYNLPHVMSNKCCHGAIEEREESVRKAFVLLGKMEEALGFLQKLEWPCMDCDKAAYIEEWRALLLQDIASPDASTTSSYNEAEERPVSSAEPEQITVTLDCLSNACTLELSYPVCAFLPSPA